MVLRKTFFVLLSFLMFFSSSLAAQAASLGWSLNATFPSSAHYIDSLAVYQGKLYAGTCCESRVYVYDGTSWTLNFSLDNSNAHVQALGVYNGKLYAGTNYYVDGVGNRGRVWVYDGTNWSISLDAIPDDTVNTYFALTEYNNKLYAATGDSGRVWVFDGTTWTEGFNSGERAVRSLATYNGKLYAGSYETGRVYVYDGSTWQISFTPGQQIVQSLAVYNGKLYAGAGGPGNDGYVYVYDGSTWSQSYHSSEKIISALVSFRNRLYAGGYYTGNVYAYDGATWSLDFASGEEGLISTAEYNSVLYVGSAINGKVFQFLPPYPFAGFFSPVDNPGPGPSFVFNKAKAGSAIPVKFSLGGNQGLDIFAAGYPKSEKVDCAMASSLDSIEQTVTAGGSSLSYDPATDQYSYVWKSDKGWANSCRKITVRLSDGTDHIAYFNFVK